MLPPVLSIPSVCRYKSVLVCENEPIDHIDSYGNDPISSYIHICDIPPASSGYVPPNGGPVQKGSGLDKGWIDKWGNKWIPDRLHIDHWDVQHKDGKGYTNVYLDGTKRQGKGKLIHFPNDSEVLVQLS